jgi:hypothetical protein
LWDRRHWLVSATIFVALAAVLLLVVLTVGLNVQQPRRTIVHIADAATTRSATSSAGASEGQSVTPDQDAVRRMATADQIPVVDSTGAVRGTVNRTDLYKDGTFEARSPLMLVSVHDDAGKLVGYYGNVTGFLERSVVERPGFDLYTYAKEHNTLPSTPVGG